MTQRLLSRYQKLLTWLALPVILSRLFEANARRRRPVAKAALLRMALKSTLTSHRVQTASHYYEHLTMISAFLGMPEDVPGVVVECGCFKGGSTINLSMGAKLAGRELHVYDSFAGLPDPEAGDLSHTLLGRPVVHTYEAGMYAGSLPEVRGNVERYGNVEVCSFHPGFFSDSMAGFDTPVVMAFVDVDLVSSLEDTVRAIWPKLADGGSFFIHEAEHQEMVDFFYDQTWWRENLDSDAPGLIGGGTGIGLEPQDGLWGSGLAFTVKNPRVREYAVVAG
jgi:O-methyltransferase